jgi:hypothetical protein
MRLERWKSFVHLPSPTSDEEGDHKSTLMRRSLTPRRRPPVAIVSPEASTSSRTLAFRGPRGSTMWPEDGAVAPLARTRHKRPLILRLLFRLVYLQLALLVLCLVLLVQPLEQYTFTAAHVNEPLVLLSRESPLPPLPPSFLPSQIPPESPGHTRREGLEGLLGQRPILSVVLLFTTITFLLVRQGSQRRTRRQVSGRDTTTRVLSSGSVVAAASETDAVAMVKGELRDDLESLDGQEEVIVVLDPLTPPRGLHKTHLSAVPTL